MLFTNITAAAVLAVLNFTAALSIAKLVFTGPAAAFLPMAIGLFMLGNVIAPLIIPRLSADRGQLASIRTGQAPIFAGIGAGIAAQMVGAEGEAVAVTLTAAILLATMLTGGAMLLLGVLRAGAVVRNIPFPVMAGFFAGLGYLVAVGGAAVAVEPLARLGDPASLRDPAALRHLAAALAFALGLMVIERRVQHSLLLPVYILLAAGLLYVALAVQGTSLEEARAAAWLMRVEAAEGRYLPVLLPAQLSLIDWSAIAAQAGTIAVLILLSVIMLLLDVSGIELIADRDLDPNQELRAAGIGNLVGGVGGGALSFQSLADTAFARQVGGEGYSVVVLHILLIFGLLLAGPAVIGFVPPFILAGLLLYVGFSLLIAWVWQARRLMPPSDFVVLLIILFAVAVWGILEGVAVGIVLATALFAHRYARLPIVRFDVSGGEVTSIIDRSAADQAVIDAERPRLRIIALQGYIFFGSVARLVERLKARLRQPETAVLRSLLLDFSKVQGADSSTRKSVERLMQICARQGIEVMAAGASDLDLGLEGGGVRCFDSLQDALAWHDEQALAAARKVAADGGAETAALLDRLFEGVPNAPLETVDLAAGETLFAQGDPGEAMYFLQRGRIRVDLAQPSGRPLTVRAMRPGAVLGEMALYTGAPRSATAIAEEQSRLLRMSATQFNDLQNRHPAAAARLHAFLVTLMAERLARANREMIALSR